VNNHLCSAHQKAAPDHEDQARESRAIGETLQTESRYFLAIVRPDNLARLAEIGMQFFAINSTKIRISAGDRTVIYKLSDTTAKSAGIVGTFKVTCNPYSNNQRIFVRGFSTHIPWAPIILAPDKPIPFAPLIPNLTFVSIKSNYGSALQGSLKRLPHVDDELIEAALANHVNALQPEAKA
jgi:predicted RNA-binding protein